MLFVAVVAVSAARSAPPRSDGDAVKAPIGAGCDGSDWVACRAAFADAVYGDKVTPRAPDFVIPRPDYRMTGLPGPGAGTGVGDVSEALPHFSQHHPLRAHARTRAHAHTHTRTFTHHAHTHEHH
jgi:hypothetical protein